jgi:hypothetical protein
MTALAAVCVLTLGTLLAPAPIAWFCLTALAALWIVTPVGVRR